MTGDARVHLISCVGAVQDPDLAGHFVAHYLELGVPPENIHLIVHAGADDSEALEELLGRLHDLGVEGIHPWRGVYTSAAMWRRRRALQRQVVAAQDWTLSADVDEFHVYPAPLGEVVDHLDSHGLNVLQGPMIDRVAPGGVLARVDRERPLTEQFPVVADVVCPLRKVSGSDVGGTVKVMLSRGDVLPGIGGHGVWTARHGPRATEGIGYAAGRPLASFPEVEDAGWRFAQPVAVHHYKWTAGLAQDLRRRREAPGASEPGLAYGRAVIDHLDRHDGRIGLGEVRVAHAAPGRVARLLGRFTPGGAPAASGASYPRSYSGTSAPTTDAWQDRSSALRDRPPATLPDTPRRRRLSEEAPRVADGWQVRRLTHGTAAGRFHAHSDDDLAVLDDSAGLIVAHRARIEDRWMTPQDAVTVGVVDREQGGFTPIADTVAWGWQQGPRAQWVPGSRRLVWNDRDGDRFVARLHDVDTGETRSLPRSVYAIAPDGATALDLDMARLARVQPAYGYVGGGTRGADAHAPDDDGLWLTRLADGSSRLVLSLADAAELLVLVLPDAEREELTSMPRTFWFASVTFSPDGDRFTATLRRRVASLEDPWTESQSAAVTAAVDGTDLRLLCRAASHVVWHGEEELICWDAERRRLAVMRDAPRGELLRDLPPDVVDRGVRIHPLPRLAGHHLYAVPVARTAQLRLLDEQTGTSRLLAELEGHQPAQGPFRCDLRPVPSADGGVTVFTSLHDGGRQVYMLERH